MNLKEVKVGDTLVRSLGGIPMNVVVGVVKDDVIICGSPCGTVQAVEGEGWTFRKDNGAEVDEDLGWDGITKTGSIIEKIVISS